MNPSARRSAPLWQSGVIPESPFFQMRQFTRNFFLDAVGLWSYPAFLLRQGRLLWLHVVCPLVRDEEKPGYWIFRPRAAAWTKPEDIVVARYQDFTLDEDPFSDLTWDSPVGRFPHAVVSDLTAEDLLHEELNLLCGYREAGQIFLNTGTLVPEFRERYVRLTHPVLLRAVCKLAPEFHLALAR